MKPYFIGKNHMKRLKQNRIKFLESSDISQSELEFLLWAYDLEFFTLKFASEDYEMNQSNLSNRLVYPLMNSGYIYKHFDKLTSSKLYEDQLFRGETKFNYRVRYAITQKARLAVQRFYSLFE
jgi:hypothetical protein